MSLTDLPKAYDPKDAQDRWYQFWLDKGYFHADVNKPGEPYCVVIPPPNVTGALHLGHALNNTLQDVLIRWRRMQGYNALWMPGTDHAGIATQAVVEKRLLETEKKTRHAVGREELVRQIWAWKDEYEARILGQLRLMGCSCDWDRTRFTLDETCSRAVRRTFFNLFRAGKIFRGQRLVNWDCQLQTSVADDETENVKQKGKFYYFRYPVLSGPPNAEESMLIATTRPETMLGDTAVAVHPEPARELDKRERELQAELATAGEKDAKELRDRLESLRKRRADVLPLLEKLAAMAAGGTMLELPMIGRAIPLIADRHADPEKGTGAVKITPAHDFNDFEVGRRHPEIGPPINILKPDGTINDNGRGEFRGRAYSYAGRDRRKVREAVIADLTELGLFEKSEDVENTLPVSDRSKTPVEPLLSEQWFVRMGDDPDGTPGFAQQAIDVVAAGKIKVHPERYAKSYTDWLAEKRDWCISRQLWWGHRIPVWSKTITAIDPADALGQLCDHPALYMRTGDVEAGTQVLVCVDEGHADLERQLEALGFVQDPDVLDTWFSSALWPHSTLGWPEATPELAKFYPTSVLSTARDIITLWVARMVIFGQFNLNEVPFRNVYIHPVILDGKGERMSKSKGNGVDPVDIIELFGADALRFGMASLATETQDVRIPVEKATLPDGRKVNSSERFELARPFANKFWNSARFALMNLGDFDPSQPADFEKLSAEDAWILGKLRTTTAAVTAGLEAFQFGEVARLLREFTWSDVCDWYLELVKPRLRTDGRRAAQDVLVLVLDGLCRLLHPIMPFVTEQVWQALNQVAPRRRDPATLAWADAAESVCIAAWPAYPDRLASRPDADATVAQWQEKVTALRNLRASNGVAAAAKINPTIVAKGDAARMLLLGVEHLKGLTGAETVRIVEAFDRPAGCAVAVLPDAEVCLPLEGLVDPEAEKGRHRKTLADLDKQLAGHQQRLGNAAFVANAPPAVVEQAKAKMAELQAQREAVVALLGAG